MFESSNILLAISQVINGLQLGSIYALIALGYSMVYGIIKLTNFAHGDIIMVAGYVAVFSMLKKINPVISILFAIISCILTSVLIEKTAYRPLRHAPKISLLIVSIGVSIFIENLVQILFSASSKPFPASSIFIDKKISLSHGVVISSVTLVTVFIAITSMILLFLLVNKSQVGRAMRAVSEDVETARLMGINIDNVITLTFVVGSALAGLASILFCSRYPLIFPTMGYMIGMKAFISAVLGGIGSISGAVFGGFLIGMCEVLISANNMSSWVDAVVFIILIVVLTVKPSGILGKANIEKV